MNRFHIPGLIHINLYNIQLSRSEIATRIAVEAKIGLNESNDQNNFSKLFKLSFAENPEMIKLFRKI